MRRCFMTLMLCLLLPLSVALAADKVEKPKSCQECGMDRVTYARSRMVIVFADGTSLATCSIHCAAAEMKEHKGKQVKSLKVADYATKELIDATGATWVVGGAKQGVMTAVAKWAFARKESAQRFVKDNGGRLTTFDEALELALKENE